MERVTPSDRDRAVRRMAAATGAITVGSITLTGVFMGLAKHETDAQSALKARQKASQLTEKEIDLAAAQPSVADAPPPGPPVVSVPLASPGPDPGPDPRKRPTKKRAAVPPPTVPPSPPPVPQDSGSTGSDLRSPQQPPQRQKQPPQRQKQPPPVQSAGS